MTQSHAEVNSVPLLDVSRSNTPLREEILEALAAVYDSGRFLHGPEVSALEQHVSELCNVQHAVGCASGSDALLLALMANGIGPGDEVILPSFTFFATASCVSRVGAKIVFADIDPATYNISPAAIESLITPRTRAVIPVHLFGQSAKMDEISKIAGRHDIQVIEDAAQAIGAAYHGRPVGSWGQIGCISFYPTKNLGGFGDGGMLTTQSETVADKLRLFAAHGMQPRYHHREIGINSRLDTFQAAALLVKIQHLAKYTADRQANAARYFELFAEHGLSEPRDGGAVQLPYQDPAAFHVWNQFSLRVSEGRRDDLRKYLTDRKIGSEIYYPIPLHQQACFRELGYTAGSLPQTEQAAREILHLPIYPELTEAEQVLVVETIAKYYREAYQRSAA
ncbi:DegT/DnrJ/EryC1/StrS family aminotransferase [Aureliella helgolandensis]|uniref:Aminotransferase n=1 Tax=Aureliella helgolandensis TaxID=2527968 RepID=A0A518G5Z9_9BACT|nr:DegT/DnrJ/EryC1/StrS family aminotransferase [Aureliella helgolandensis]QDV24017.1 Aminotransferase [Aureliella helgolandensis]